MLGVACAAGGDDGDLDGGRDAGGEVAVEAGAGAVGVHAGEQDFAGAALLGLAGPVDDAQAGRFAAAGDVDFGFGDGVVAGLRRARASACVDGDDDGLCAEGCADFADEVGPGDGGGVDGNLVGTGVEDGFGVCSGADAAADGEGDEELGGGSLHRVDQRSAAFVGGGDVEQDDLVGTGGGVAVGELGGVAGVDDVEELDAFDDAAGADVEAGDDALSQHSYNSRKVSRENDLHICPGLYGQFVFGEHEEEPL